MLADTPYSVLSRNALPQDGTTYEFEGARYQDTPVSFILVDMPPGRGMRLHKHPYQEIFFIQEGTSSFTVGSQSLEAQAGQIVIVPADMPHKFQNNGTAQLRQVDIHVSREFVTIWLEE